MSDPRHAASGLDRRQFVAAAGMAAAAAVGVPLIARGAERGRASDPQPGAAPEPKGTPLTGTLRIGLIGCGGRGTGAALQALKADPDSKLVAMGDIFSERIDSSLAEIAKALGDKAEGRLDVPQERRFTGFDCHDKVLAAGVDVVLLCGYPAFRPAQYRAAIEAGKHVFVEKPLAVDGPGVRHVLETARMARSKGLSSLVGFCWRYNTGMREAYRRIHEGPIGDVVSAHTTYYTGTLPKRKRQPEWSDVEFQLRNWWHFAWISGDHIVEQAIHSIDRMAWAMGDRLPRQVVCLGGRQARTGEESGNVFDHFSAVFEYEDGLRAFHGTRQMDGCPSDNNDYIFGTKGSALVDGWRPLYQAKDPSGKVIWQRTDKDPDMYQCEHNELFAGIRSGNVINDTERGAHSTLMAIMARTSAYSGQTVTWEQAMNSEEKLGPDIVVFGPMPVAPVPVPGRKQQAPPSKG